MPLIRNGPPVVFAVLLLALTVASSDARAAKRKPVSVYPSPGTVVASDATTFSFRGLRPRHLGPVKVYGSRSGFHRGSRLRHSDGRGVSFVPRHKFIDGETVRVYTGKRIKLARHGDFRVRIGRFPGRNLKRADPFKANRFPRLHSRPDLRPPKLNLLATSEGAAPGKILFAPKQTGLTIADRLGRVYWFEPNGYRGRRSQVQNFETQELNGKPVLTYWEGTRIPGTNHETGTVNILNDNYKRIARFTTGNGYRTDGHEFSITPRNTALVLACRSVKWNLKKFGGPAHGSIVDDVVQEIDIKTGAVLFEWHSVGNVGLGASVGRIPEDGSPWDYFHANSVDWDGDSLLVSARKVSTVYRINRSTARVRWRLRGDGLKPKRNDFKMTRGSHFAYQHDAERLPNGDISMFDNGTARRFPAINRLSSALILRLRGVKGKPAFASPVRRYRVDPNPVVSHSQGSVEVLPHGNVFVGWGSVSRMTEFAPEGKVVFDATFYRSPVNSYRSFKSTWSGQPRARPAIASRKNRKGGGSTVWASWNGATTVDRWQLVSGPDRKHLDLVATSPWKGLETAIPASRTGPWVRVVALDADGQRLAKSAVTRVGSRSR